MATEYLFLKGKGAWIRPDRLNDWGKWSMVLYPDPESLEKIKDLQAQGMKNVLRKDDDGYNINISRPNEIEVRGKKQGLTAPVVFDGRVPNQDGSFRLLTEPVGNGSDVVVKCEVYTHGIKGTDRKAKAMRWYSVRVDNLVPFAKKEDFTKAEAAAEVGFAAVKKQLF